MVTVKYLATQLKFLGNRSKPMPWIRAVVNGFVTQTKPKPQAAWVAPVREETPTYIESASLLKAYGIKVANPLDSQMLQAGNALVVDPLLLVSLIVRQPDWCTLVYNEFKELSGTVL
jgi:hypothetical protein